MYLGVPESLCVPDLHPGKIESYLDSSGQALLTLVVPFIVLWIPIVTVSFIIG